MKTKLSLPRAFASWCVGGIVLPALFLLFNSSVPNTQAQSGNPSSIYLPIVMRNWSGPVVPGGADWLQLGHDSQRTNATGEQIDPPYCYTWKWYEAPLASRAQPVVANGRLFIGSMDGIFYARNAGTGAPLWSYATGSPIRHSAGVIGDTVVFTNHAGTTFALDAITGEVKWQRATGSNSTAPLMDATRNWVYVASSNGTLTALRLSDSAQQWQYDSGAPILTSPALSADGQTVFTGNEAIYAIAVNANTGAERWRTTLQGESLADRYPVVAGASVMYRSQPLYFFHQLLHDGDTAMDQAGTLNSDWTADWAAVRPRIVSHLTANPAQQSFFVLDTSTGASRGVAPVLYTYGNNDIPNVPVVQNNNIFVTYRARHGIQTDSNTVHVSSKYDAELGQMNLSTLDIAGLRSSAKLGASGVLEWRLTSDEPAMMTLGGNILWIDNWERLGGINVQTGQLIHIGGVSNDWPECGGTACGPETPNPFFPLSGSGAAWPFPSPRVTDGHQRGGAIVANGMIYWRVIEGGLAGISHRSGSACPTSQVWTANSHAPIAQSKQKSPAMPTARALAEYLTLDLTTPIASPSADLVARVRREVSDLIASNAHLMPFYLERGFSYTYVWPRQTPHPEDGNAAIGYEAHGSAFWHDPGELLYTMALAYPYLDSTLQNQLKAYLAAEMQRYSPLQDLPWNDANHDWLRQGTARELYTVPFRSQLNNWPPVAADISALDGLWLWSKNTGDWGYAQAHWSEATTLFNARRSSMNYYADIAGAIGYYRLADHFGDTTAKTNAQNAAIAAMQAGLNFTTFRQRAEQEFKDPRDETTGWYAPAFFGMTPEVGLYLREQIGNPAIIYLQSKEDGDALRWWYLTRAGAHAEIGETSYVAPQAAWSHFLAHAYVVGDAQTTLRPWLDRPWARGDLYAIQKLVATIHAP